MKEAIIQETGDRLFLERFLQEEEITGQGIESLP